MKLFNIIFSIVTVVIFNSNVLFANCADKKIAIYVEKISSIHTGLIIPNTHNIFKDEFLKDVPYIVVNWGSEMFYRAGADQKEQIMAAPTAMLFEGPAVVLIEPLTGIYSGNKGADQLAQINISEQELAKLEKAILKLVRKNIKGKFLKISTEGDENTLAQYGSNFYYSTVNYQGIKLTCNGMLGNLLSENVENFGTFTSYLPNPLMQYLETKSKDPSSCIEAR
jgi:hypothetical protein